MVKVRYLSFRPLLDTILNHFWTHLIPKWESEGFVWVGIFHNVLKNITPICQEIVKPSKYGQKLALKLQQKNGRKKNHWVRPPKDSDVKINYSFLEHLNLASNLFSCSYNKNYSFDKDMKIHCCYKILDFLRSP